MPRAARELLKSLAIPLIALLVYWPALGAGFVFDDHSLVERSVLLLGPVSRAWTSTSTTDYWPLTWTVLWLARRAFGLAPLGYHLLGVLLHAGVGLLLWRALRRLSIRGAWLAGLLLVVHPAAVESVAWISELKNTVSAIPFLLATLAWLRFDETQRPRWLLVTAGAFLLACLAKGSVVMLPLVLGAITWVRRGRLERWWVAALAPLLAVSLLAGVVNVWFQHHNAQPPGLDAGAGWLDRLGGAGFALGYYLRAALVPVSLGFVHDPWPLPPGSAANLLPPAAVALAAVLVVLAARRWRGARPVALALAYVTGMVLPVLGLVDMAYLRIGPVANHLAYLALLGAAALGGWAVEILAARSRLARPLGAATVVVFGLVSLQRAGDFHDDVRLWAAAAQDAPRNVFAHTALALHLGSRGDVEGARRELETAIRLEPRPWRAGYLRAQLLRGQGRTAEAVAEARKAIVATADVETRRGGGELLLDAGDLAGAEAAFRSLRADAPRSSAYAILLGRALWRQGRQAEAIEVLEGFRRDRPGLLEIDAMLAVALVQVGRRDEALGVAASFAGVAAADARAQAQLRAWTEAGSGPPAPPPGE